jgi:ATP-binding cassette subfamily C protein LapB
MNLAAQPHDSAASLRQPLLDHGALGHGQPTHHALLPLLDALGWRGGSDVLMEVLSLHRQALDWNDFTNLLCTLGYGSDQRHGTLDSLQPGDVPLIFLPDDQEQEPLLLTELGAAALARYLGRDAIEPLTPVRRRGSILRFFPATAHPTDARAGQWFRELLRRFRGQFREALLLGLLINAFALSVPVFTMLVYDRVIAGHELDTLYYLLAGATMALLAEGALRMVRGLSLAWFGVRASHLMQVALFARLLGLDPLAIERAPPAAQVVRAKALEAVRDFLTGQGFILLIECPFLPLLLLVLLVFSPMMALACLLTAVAIGLVLFSLLRGLRASAQRSARAMAQRQRDALEIFSKLETLRLHGASDALYARFATHNHTAIEAAGAMVWRMQVIEHAVMGISMLGGLVTLLVGVQQVWAGALSAGGLIAAMIIAWRITMPLQQLAAMAPRLEQVSGGVQQLEQLLSLPPERVGLGEVASAHPVHGHVELVNVAMRYPRQQDAVFSGLSLRIRPGEMVAIAGANGSGKSSVLKLINGMYPQVAGSIRLDGLDIRQLDALSLRRGISYIPQSESIFSGTVRENLSLGAPFATDSDMLRALEQADAMEDVLNLPRGLDTVMGAQGVQVPQVLAFKLALARSYVNLKPLILCDELPYALLSTPAGELFRAQLQRLKGKFTIILVAHTSDLVRMADQAVFLQANHRPVVGRPADILPRMLEQSYGIFG